MNLLGKLDGNPKMDLLGLQRDQMGTMGQTNLKSIP